MRAHIIENGVVINTVLVEELAPNMVEATNGSIGDLYDGNSFTKPAPITVVPQVISKRQCVLVLNEAGRLTEIENAVAAAPVDVQLSWEYASEIRRADPMVLSMAQALGWTEQQLDQLFILGAQK